MKPPCALSSRWQFRPGTKAGEPVELEAVVQIPFRKHHIH